MRHDNSCITINLTLLELSKMYLDMRRKQYTAADILEVSKRILQWSEQKNRFCKNPKIKFKKDCIEINEKYLK